LSRMYSVRAFTHHSNPSFREKSMNDALLPQ